MSDATVKEGTLTDFEGSTVRIDDNPYPATPAVMQVCRNILAKRSKVDYRIEKKDGVDTVTDIRPHKDPQPAPIAQQQKPAEKRTSPESPAAAPAGKDEKWIDLQGKCSAMEAATRSFSIKDLQDAVHPFKWGELLDAVMLKNGVARWQVGYYLTVKYNPDTHEVKNVTYWNEGKEEWAKAHQNNSGGRRPYTPRNEKPPVYACCYKECAETARALLVVPDQVFDKEQADEIMDWVLERAKRDAAELCREAGA